MPILHRSHLWLALALAGAAMPLAAQPAAEVEGVYETRIMEVGSALILSPSGRFLWAFSTGALDVLAEGRWTREADGSVVLNSDPAVAPPRFELIGRRRDDRPGVAVRLACDSGQAWQYLDPVVEYADGQRETGQFESLEFRTSADSRRRVAAVYVGSAAFDLMSERVPVDPAEANVFTFRFIPNDIGRVEFRNQRVAVEGGALSFTWRGMPLRYTREGTASGEPLPRLPLVPSPAAEAAPAPLVLQIGEPLAGVRTRNAETLVPMDGDGYLVARGPVDLRLGYGGSSFDLGRVEGGRSPLTVADYISDGTASGITFSYPPDLTLDEALARSRAFIAWLEQVGFQPIMAASEYGDIAPFTTMPGDGSEGRIAASWEEAARLLADDAQAVTAMQLYSLRSPAHMVFLRLENARRYERQTCPHSEWLTEGGREWRLQVTISPNLEMRMVEEPTAADMTVVEEPPPEED